MEMVISYVMSLCPGAKFVMLKIEIVKPDLPLAKL